MDFNEKVNRIINARNGKIYADYPEQDRHRALSGVLTKNYRRKGQSISPENLIDTVDFIDNDVRDHYGKELTYGEVELAIDWGIRGEYGEFTGLNADRLFRFIKNYVESSERLEAIRRKQAESQERPKVRQDNVGYLNWIAMRWRTERFFEEFAENGRINAVHSHYNADDESFNGRLQVAESHNAGACYRWLRCIGLVARDGATMDAESEALKIAEKRCRNNDVEARSLADAMMLENFIRIASDSGYDIQQAFEEIPEDERTSFE